MEITFEEQNFIKMARIFLDVAPRYLRKLFVDKWDEKHPNQKWQSDNVSGAILIDKLPPEIKSNRRNKLYLDKMEAGNEEDWDTTTLVFALLFSHLNLIQVCRPRNKRKFPLRTSEEIDIIRETRNEFFAHASSMRCSSSTFMDIVSKMKNVSKNIFGDNAEKEIGRIEMTQVKVILTDEQRHQLNKEKNGNAEFETLVKEMRDNLKEIKEVVNETKLNVKDLTVEMEEMKTVLQTNQQKACMQSDSGNLKSRYKSMYQTHPIHIADQRGRVDLVEIDLDEFAVKLKICYDSPPGDTLRDEVRRHFSTLRSVQGYDIDVSHLIDKRNRVTFIRGIAGMGKSVLSKQVACGWADGSMYTDYAGCIFLECRDINFFHSTKGAKFKVYELLDEFIKENFKFDLGDGEGVFFVIDGLDELYDINSNDSIIKQLLCRKIYRSSKVIITGRPHIESKLKGYGEVGGVRKLEIQGLKDKHIEEYIRRFPSPQGVTVDISNAKDSSGRYFPIIHVPQFLNTFCCVASLLKGQPIRNAAELYCWTVYLLLTQHADKQETNGTNTVSEIFCQYSQELLILGKVCYKLLCENKIIMRKEDIDSLLPDCVKGKNFINSLFVDASDNFTKKLQFKHLTLMEFLSAVYVCSIQNHMEVIQENLKKGFLELVVFACQLILGFRYDGIIKELLRVNSSKFEELAGNEFFTEVLALLRKCQEDELVVLTTSLDIIILFLSKDGYNRDFVVSETVSTLQMKDVNLYEENSRKLNEIIEHLEKKCHLKESELQLAFHDTTVGLLHVNAVNQIKHGKYFGHVDLFIWHDMELSVNVARREFEALGSGKCKRVRIKDCKLEDDEIERRSSNVILDRLVIMGCTLKNAKSLINAFLWATSSQSSSCEILEFFELEVEDGWWTEFVTAIEEEKNTHGHIRLRELYIDDCTTNMSKDLQLRVVRCGITLVIDGQYNNPLFEPANGSCCSCMCL